MGTHQKEIKIKLVQLEIAAMEKAISLYDQIVAIIPKFDGKAPNKRFDTALKNIDPQLSFKMEFNSFKIKMYNINRFFESGNGGAFYTKDYEVYLLHECISSSFGDGICQNGMIDGPILLEKLKLRRAGLIEYVGQLKESLKKLDAIIARHQEIIKLKDDFEKATPALIRDYFELK
jgi:hypothetical protein